MPTLYFNAAEDNDWDNVLNWWTDADCTVQAGAIPTSADDVLVDSVSITSNSGDPAECLSLVMTDSLATGCHTDIEITIFGSFEYRDGAFTNFGTTIWLPGNATGLFVAPSFHGAGSLNLSGTATVTLSGYGLGDFATVNLSDSSALVLAGCMTGGSGGQIAAEDSATVQFDDSSCLYGVACSDDASVTFDGTSSNRGVITGPVTFNDTSYNDSFTVSGAVFNDSATNNGAAANSEFNDSSANYGTVSGGVFNDSSVNHGDVNDGVVFNDNSYNDTDGEIIGSAVFNDASHNAGTVTDVEGGLVIEFNGSSFVSFGGEVQASALTEIHFNDLSYTQSGASVGEYLGAPGVLVFVRSPAQQYAAFGIPGNGSALTLGPKVTLPVFSVNAAQINIEREYGINGSSILGVV